MTRRNPSLLRPLKILLLVLTTAWIAFVLYLDITYSMFPRVLYGGLKILIAGYVGLGVLAVFLLLLRRILFKRPSAAG